MSENAEEAALSEVRPRVGLLSSFICRSSFVIPAIGPSLKKDTARSRSIIGLPSNSVVVLFIGSFTSGGASILCTGGVGTSHPTSFLSPPKAVRADSNIVPVASFTSTASSGFCFGWISGVYRRKEDQKPGG